MSGVVILGMHRSGTSLLVGLLEEHGFYLGKVSQQKSPLKPTGTKENLVIRNINNQLFKENGSSWKSPSIPKSISNNLYNQIVAISKNFQAEKLWAIKDPRMIFSYSIWKDFLPKHKCVATFRNPLNVAISLKRKNNMPITESLRLWDKYNSELIKLRKNLFFPFINFDEPKENYFYQFQKIAKYLKIEAKQNIFDSFYSHIPTKEYLDPKLLTTSNINLIQKMQDFC